MLVTEHVLFGSLARTFDQILSKLEGTRGSPRRLRWTPHSVQLLGTTENLSSDARLPVE